MEIRDLRLGAHEARTRLVIEMTEKVPYNVFLLANPYRAVVELPAATWAIADIARDTGLVSGVRYGAFQPTQARVVLDLRGPVKVQQQLQLDPSLSNPHYRLVIDFVPVVAAEFTVQKANRAPVSQSASQSALGPNARPVPQARVPQTRVPQTQMPQARVPQTRVPQAQMPQAQVPLAQVPLARPKQEKKIIVLDPGHGGVDPGARGRSLREKDIVLSFARELAAQLRASGHYQVYLTRQKDVYITLRERVRFARRKNADLFISIHADAIRKRNIRGLSVYTLSEKASDSEAAALAANENRSDIIAGMDFGDQLPEVTDILIDLAQRGTKNSSVKFANHVIDHAKHSTRLLERPHRYAGFRVLKAPDVPSVLIELGFLTN
ncbi:MAG: N-acetylmuramoyl-L-alanine amidase, partial [Alphaproteobacteria bacterium]|nr:N-acetylmuramoyl-L-alanine amidase [Alphaproteobacteria bacterium]